MSELSKTLRTHPSLLACHREGSLQNPVRVMIRSHEQKAMIFRYLIYKGIEIALDGVLTRGQRTSTVTDTVTPAKPGFAVALAKRQGYELAIRGQVEKDQWFFVAPNRRVLFFRDKTGDVAAVFDTANGKVQFLEKTSVGDFVDQHFMMKERQDRDWQEAAQKGLAT